MRHSYLVYDSQRYHLGMFHHEEEAAQACSGKAPELTDDKRVFLNEV